MSAEIVNTVTGEVYEAGLTPFEARQLTDEIRQTLTLGHDLLIRAYTGRAWTALGYDTWDAYCAGEFSEARMVRLDREQRREIVAEMREAGMSTRAIASGLGVNHSTVVRDGVADVDASAPREPTPYPRPVTGLDGKTYTKPSVAPTPHRPSTPTTKRRPLIDGFFDAAYDLTKVTERLERLVADDRFPQNAQQVAAKHRSDLSRAAEALARVLDRLASA